MGINFFKNKAKPNASIKKLNLPSVTLAALASTNIEETVKSLLFSSRDINFAEILLISHERPKFLPEKIKYREIKEIDSYERYNYHVTYSLQHYIQTSHVLLVQHDGFVINPDSWSGSFLEYDYIGAPFPIPRDNFSYRDDLGRLVRVGNGGFSLRSKLILQAPDKLRLIWESFHGYFHEDGFLCCKNRSALEGFGVKFAPINVAAQFSMETKVDENKSLAPFGTHGIQNLKKYKKNIEKYVLNLKKEISNDSD